MNIETFRKNKKDFLSKKEFCLNLEDTIKSMEFIKESIGLFKKYIDDNNAISFDSSGHNESVREVSPELFDELDGYFRVITERIHYLKDNDKRFKTINRSVLAFKNPFYSLKKDFWNFSKEVKGNDVFFSNKRNWSLLDVAKEDLNNLKHQLEILKENECLLSKKVSLFIRNAFKELEKTKEELSKILSNANKAVKEYEEYQRHGMNDEEYKEYLNQIYKDDIEHQNNSYAERKKIDDGFGINQNKGFKIMEFTGVDLNNVKFHVKELKKIEWKSLTLYFLTNTGGEFEVKITTSKSKASFLLDVLFDTKTERKSVLKTTYDNLYEDYFKTENIPSDKSLDDSKRLINKKIEQVLGISNFLVGGTKSMEIHSDFRNKIHENIGY